MTLLPIDAQVGAPVEGEEPDVGARAIEGRSTWQLAWAKLRKDRAAMISLGIICVIVLVAIFAPFFATVTGHGVNHQYRTTGLNGFGQPVSPSRTFLLGTDDLGRDILVRIAYGARISLFVGVVATLLTVAIGAVLGLVAGYLGGVVDSIVARLVDLVLSLPFLLFAIALVSVHGPGIGIVIIVIAVFGWAAVARIVRGQVLSIREKEYIEAARSLGASSWRIMFVDVPPQCPDPADHLCHAADPRHYRARGQPVVSWFGHPASDRRLGPDDRRVGERVPAGVVVPGVPGIGPAHYDDLVQHSR